MNALNAIFRELLGLVVDDVGFAASIVGWIAAAWLLSAYILPPSPWFAIVVFAGLGGILLESALRRAGAAQ